MTADNALSDSDVIQNTQRAAGVDRKPRCVVYTCMFGHSEQFNDFHYERDDIDFVCFTDDPDLKSSFWRIELQSRNFIDPGRASRFVKTQPHRFFPDHDWSLYIDNIVKLKVPPKQIFDRFLANAASPLVCFKHPDRNCVYDEANVVLDLQFDDPGRVRGQMEHYHRLGYPRKNGLAKATISVAQTSRSPSSASHGRLVSADSCALQT